MKQIKKSLENCDIKPTYQRMCILEMFREKHDHLTAETIYENLVQRIPTMSRTTVYNTLALFLKQGLIHCITITGTELRYGIGSPDHHHFLCQKCGKIIDIDVQCPFSTGKVKEVEGNRIEEIHGYFKGVCRECNEDSR